MQNSKTNAKQPKDCPDRINCPCGGGQSCIVHRRLLGDWVYEDDVYREAGIPVREHCFTQPTQEQREVMSRKLHR